MPFSLPRARYLPLQRSRGWITPETRRTTGVCRGPCWASTEPGLDHPGDVASARGQSIDPSSKASTEPGLDHPGDTASPTSTWSALRGFNGAGAGSPRRPHTRCRERGFCYWPLQRSRGWITPETARRLPPWIQPPSRFNGAGAGSPRRLAHLPAAAALRRIASTEPGLDHPGDHPRQLRPARSDVASTEPGLDHPGDRRPSSRPSSAA